MADFVGLLKKTIDGQPHHDAPLRAKIYQRARQTALKKLNEVGAPKFVIDKQFYTLNRAIEEVEHFYSHTDRAPQPRQAAQTGMANRVASPPSQPFGQSPTPKSQLDEAHALMRQGRPSAHTAQTPNPAQAPKLAERPQPHGQIWAKEDGPHQHFERAPHQSLSGEAHGQNPTTLGANTAHAPAQPARAAPNNKRLFPLKLSSRLRYNTLTTWLFHHADPITRANTPSHLPAPGSITHKPALKPAKKQFFVGYPKKPKANPPMNETLSQPTSTEFAYDGDVDVVSDLFQKAEKRKQREAVRKKRTIIVSSIAALGIFAAIVISWGWNYLVPGTITQSLNEALTSRVSQPAKVEKLTHRLNPDGTTSDPGPAQDSASAQSNLAP